MRDAVSEPLTRNEERETTNEKRETRNGTGNRPISPSPPSPRVDEEDRVPTRVAADPGDSIERDHHPAVTEHGTDGRIGDTRYGVEGQSGRTHPERPLLLELDDLPHQATVGQEEHPAPFTFLPDAPGMPAIHAPSRVSSGSSSKRWSVPIQAPPDWCWYRSGWSRAYPRQSRAGWRSNGPVIHDPRTVHSSPSIVSTNGASSARSGRSAPGDLT